MATAKHRRITAEDMAHRRIAEGHSLTAGQLAAVERERAEWPPLPDPPDPLLARPGVIHAVFWARCRGCGAVIHGPAPKGCDPCPCGTTHARGDLVGLSDVATGRAWVCRACLVASLDHGAHSAAEPRGVHRPTPESREAVCGATRGQQSASLTDAVPAPRAGDLEGAKR